MRPASAWAASASAASTAVIPRAGAAKRARSKNVSRHAFAMFPAPPRYGWTAGKFGAVYGKADDGVRTRDPQLGKLMLYQLSYVRVSKRVPHPRSIRG